MDENKNKINSVSIVVPVYNSADTLEELVERLVRTLDSKIKYNIVLSVDGSPDNSYEVCCQLVEKYPSNVCAIELMRNFGQQNAKMAGLQYADGDVVVFMDDDLQNPPESIFELINAIEQGNDAVYTYSGKKKQSGFKNFGSKVNDCMARFLLNKPKELQFSSYQAISRSVADSLRKNNNPFPYPSGNILQCTRKIAQIEVSHLPRKKGVSNYTFRKLFFLWLNGFVGFSIRPLRIASFIGFFLFIFAFIFSAYLLIHKLFYPRAILSGWTSLMLVMLMLFGFLFFILGIIGEYIGRILLLLNGKPQYVVRQIKGVKVKIK